MLTPLRKTLRIPLVVLLLLGLSTAATAQVTHVVEIGAQPSQTFDPNDLIIQIGDTVRWVWVSGTHNVVSLEGFFSSGAPTGPPNTFEHTFDAAFLAANPTIHYEYLYQDDISLDLGAVHVRVPFVDLQVFNLVAGQTATFAITGASPGRVVRSAYSAQGAGPTQVNLASCGLFNVALSQPIHKLPVVTADTDGNASFTAPIPAGTIGRQIWVQSVDVWSCRLSNSWTGVIQ